MELKLVSKVSKMSKQTELRQAAKDFIANDIAVYDSHTHLHDLDFQADMQAVIAACQNSSVKQMLLPSDDAASSARILTFHANLQPKQRQLFRYAIAFHPHAAHDFVHNDGLNFLKNLIAKMQVQSQLLKTESFDLPVLAGIGEIGLDYYYDNSPRDEQKTAFISQIELAKEYNLPISVHSREAHKDTLDILSYAKSHNLLLDTPGAIHCYSGSVEHAKRLLDLGFYLGFDGPITFKNARQPLEVIQYCPLDRILIETDAPYLTPEPFRGQRNEPSYVKLVLRKIAEIKGMDVAIVAERIYQNTMQVFGHN